MLITTIFLSNFFLIITQVNGQLLEGLYCGKENCYDVLGVKRDTIKSEIAKSYRRLARQFHPDLHRSPEAKEAAESKFKEIANAYEILKDEESRTDYDYMLDNPDAYYAHYYRYYRRRVSPKVDVRIVIFVTLTIISAIQYFTAKQRYISAVKRFMAVPKYRNRALDIAKEEGLIQNEKRSKKSKVEQKEEIENIIQSIIEDKMDIKGACSKPTFVDLLWVQLVILPYTIIKFVYWHLSFYWRHTILKQPYNREEKLYLIRKFMKMGQDQFDTFLEEQENLLAQELWIRENFEEWKQKEQERIKVLKAENSRQKKARRMMKKYGIPRMTFDDS